MLISKLNRRQALALLGGGFGSVGLHAALAQAASPVRTAAFPGSPPARAKHIIFVCLNGGISQVDTFDPKPLLDRLHGQPLPTGENPKTERKTGTLMRSPFAFRRHGKSGIPVSELFPRLATMVDDLCVVRSLRTTIPNHDPGLLMMTCGHTQPGRPSMGAWLNYGLGSENHNLPGFVVLAPDRPDVVGPSMWGSAFLPASHQGVFVATRNADPGQAIPFLDGPGRDLARQRRELDLAAALDRQRLSRMHIPDAQIESSIITMETAYRMQTEAPEAFDVGQEPKSVRAAYGDTPFARSCLLARRLVERGVRVVQVYFAKGNPWDHHDDILLHGKHARTADQPIAALLADLKSRGLLDETLVVIGSEFGRTPMVEISLGGPAGVRSANGRDHNPYGFTMLLAGGGLKRGHIHGATDEFGLHAVENIVDVHDLHATLLYQMGIDHRKLTYRYSGRDYRLTDVAGNVVHDIIA